MPVLHGPGAPGRRRAGVSARAVSRFAPAAHLGFYRGRMLIWQVIQSGPLLSVKERREKYFGEARQLLQETRAAFPENRVVRMYLGEPIPWPKPYPADPAAPRLGQPPARGFGEARRRDSLVDRRAPASRWPVRWRLGRRRRNVALVGAGDDRVRGPGHRRPRRSASRAAFSTSRTCARASPPA